MTSSQQLELKASLRAFIPGLSDSTVDVLLAVLSMWLDTATDTSDEVVVTSDQILDMRGLKKKSGADGYSSGHRAGDRIKMAAEISRLDNLWLTVANIEYWPENDGGRRRGRLRLEAKALIVSSRLVDEQSGIALAWSVRPGEWAQHFLDGSSRQTALLARQLLRYDPVRRSIEKRLGIYFTEQFRIRHGSGNQPWRVSTVLERIGFLIDRSHPARSRERFEEAMDRLVDDGILKSWSYVDLDEGKLARRDWVKRWLTQRIHVEPPASVTEQYAGINRKSR